MVNYQRCVDGLPLVVVVPRLQLLVGHELDGAMTHAPHPGNEALRKNFYLLEVAENEKLI